MQKLAVGLLPVMREGMSPYEMHYVLATDEEIERLNASVTLSQCEALKRVVDAGTALLQPQRGAETALGSHPYSATEGDGDNGSWQARSRFSKMRVA